MALPRVLLPVSGSLSAVHECTGSRSERPVARFTALVQVAQRRPRSIWTFYHLVLVSALCHCATPTSCLSQWVQCGWMVENPWVFSRFWPWYFISLLLLIFFLLFPCMPLSEIFIFTYLTFAQRWGCANPRLSAQWMNYISAEISHWTQMATSIQYNTVYTKVIKNVFKGKVRNCCNPKYLVYIDFKM